MKRVEHMLDSINADVVEWLDDEEVELKQASLGHRNALPRAGLKNLNRKKQLVVFSRLANRDEIHPGYSWRDRRSGRNQWQRYKVRCQTAVEIQSVIGCPFDCSYCPYGTFLSVRVDVENFVDRVMKLVKQNRTQTLYKLNNRSDTLALEPEYQLSSRLIERFASIPRKYLLLYSKGVEVDHLLDLNHGGKTVACWTLTPDIVAQQIEPTAPSLASRLEAMEKMAASGYPIRVRFSPIVPVHDWQQVYSELIQALKQKATPEMVTLWTLSMIPPDQLSRFVPTNMLDPKILEAIRKNKYATKGQKGAPFSQTTRIAIYREILSILKRELPHTKRAICLESKGVWEGLGSLIPPYSRGKFHCNCGPRSCPVNIS